MNDTLVAVENVSKKFCRNLKRSLWYGIKDLSAELIGRSNGNSSLRRDEFWALRHISLELKRGDTLGLIGRNGAGKTTLLRMLNGLIKPDGGRIEIRGRMQALIALGAGFNPILTGRENIYVNASVLGIPNKEIDRRFDEIVEFSGISEFIDTPVQSYSSGMAVRLGFAVAAHLDPDILLVDEVLAVGDEGFQSKCLSKIGQLKEKGVGIILVSHNMHTISTFSNKLIFLNKGSQELFENVSEGVKAYRRLFIENNENDIEEICSGNQQVNFYHVEIKNRNLSPGDSFDMLLNYDCHSGYFDVEVDLLILSSNEQSLHFQATNKAYNRQIDLKQGRNELRLEIENIRINNANARVSIAIWTRERQELLFWWRIPVRFRGVNHSTGNSFLECTFH